MTLRLDRTRPFGEVIPSGHLYQDGHYFNAAGEYLRSDGAAPVAPPEKEPSPVPVEIDLAAWARGEANHTFFKVVKLVRDTYPDAADVESKRAPLVDFLVSKGVISEEEAAR